MEIVGCNVVKSYVRKRCCVFVSFSVMNNSRLFLFYIQDAEVCAYCVFCIVKACYMQLYKLYSINLCFA